VILPVSGELCEILRWGDGANQLEALSIFGRGVVEFPIAAYGVEAGRFVEE